jgi:hypothetical protein
MGAKFKTVKYLLRKDEELRENLKEAVKMESKKAGTTPTWLRYLMSNI